MSPGGYRTIALAVTLFVTGAIPLLASDIVPPSAVRTALHLTIAGATVLDDPYGLNCDPSIGYRREAEINDYVAAGNLAKAEIRAQTYAAKAASCALMTPSDTVAGSLKWNAGNVPIYADQAASFQVEVLRIRFAYGDYQVLAARMAAQRVRTISKWLLNSSDSNLRSNAKAHLDALHCIYETHTANRSC